MNTLEITKLVGAACGSLLIFLGANAITEGLYHTELEEAAYSIEVAEDDAGGEAEQEESVDVATLVSEADPGAGEKVFRKCAACHKLGAGEHGVGPSLHGVVGREIASVDGFGFSDALASLEGAWEPEPLFEFLTKPSGYAPGTAMAFAGLSKDADKANLIAFLQTQN